MTSIPASRSARAMIFAPRSCPSRPGFATTTRIFLLIEGRKLPADAPGRTRLLGARAAVHGHPEQEHQPAEQEQRAGLGAAVRQRRAAIGLRGLGAGRAARRRVAARATRA